MNSFGLIFFKEVAWRHARIPADFGRNSFRGYISVGFFLDLILKLTNLPTWGESIKVFTGRAEA